MADYFLRNHILNLSKIYHVDLLANIDSNQIRKIEGLANIIHIPFRRNISLFFDIKSLIKVFFVLKKNKYSATHSVGPKSGLIAALAGFVLGVENRFHWFTSRYGLIKTSFLNIFINLLIKFSTSLILRF